VVWITGAGSGIGRAVARMFAVDGATLVVNQHQAGCFRRGRACQRSAHRAAGSQLEFDIDSLRCHFFVLHSSD